MKLAIIGSGVSAMEASWHFTQLGAQVTHFSREKFGGALYALAEDFPHQQMPWAWSELTTDLADELNIKIDLTVRPTYQQYYQMYLAPAFEFLKARIDIRSVEVQRVHKATLNLSEQPEVGSRLADTFRVVWKQNPAEMVAKMLSENQEFFELMGSDALASLEVPIESYEDFDLVIDATGTYATPLPMGAGASYALNEQHQELQKNFFYGIEAFKEIKNLKASEKVALVGSGQSALGFLSLAKNWIEENQLILITTESRALVRALENAPVQLRQDVLNFLISLDEDYQAQCESFASRMHEWRDLEENIRQKTPTPEEPKRKIEFFEKSNVLSLDRLIDREGVFLTCERSSLRDSQNLDVGLKTFSLDKVFVLTGFAKDHNVFQLMHTFDDDRKLTKSFDGDHPEVGYFTLGPTQHHKENSYSHGDIKNQLLQIEAHILKYFSRAPEQL